MKYLTTPEASLVTSWVMARYLRATGGATREDARIDLRPERYTDGEGLALQGSIAIAIDLGLVVQGDEATPILRLGPELQESGEWFDEFDEFAQEVRRSLMSQSSRGLENVSDVAMGVAWLLGSDWRKAANPFDPDDGLPEDVIRNPDQQRAFHRWVTELGFVRPDSKPARNQLLAEPTQVVRRVFRDLAGVVAAREVVESLRSVMVEGPSHPLSLLMNEGNATRSDDLEIFPAVAFALKRLEAANEIKLITRDDAPERLIYRLPSRTDQPVGVTHIEVSV